MDKQEHHIVKTENQSSYYSCTNCGVTSGDGEGICFMEDRTTPRPCIAVIKLEEPPEVFIHLTKNPIEDFAGYGKWLAYATGVSVVDGKTAKEALTKILNELDTKIINL